MHPKHLTHLRFTLSLLAPMLLLAALSACQGGSYIPAAADLTQPETAWGVAPPLSVLRETADEEPQYRYNAAQYDPTLPHRNVEEAGSMLRFKPSWDPAADPPSNDLALAIWRFALPDYDREPTLGFMWEDPPPQWADAWVILANWDRNCWDAFPAPPSYVLELESLAPYFRDDGTLLVGQVVLGTAECLLSWVRVGSRLGISNVEVVDEGAWCDITLYFVVDFPSEPPYELAFEIGFDPAAGPSVRESFGLSGPVYPVTGYFVEPGLYQHIIGGIAKPGPGEWTLALAATDSLAETDVFWYDIPTALGQ